MASAWTSTSAVRSASMSPMARFQCCMASSLHSSTVGRNRSLLPEKSCPVGLEPTPRSSSRWSGPARAAAMESRASVLAVFQPDMTAAACVSGTLECTGLS
ncbi:hypothetical protein ACFFX0_02700 [Citricoccus parietis]|uniref:Secreted protein n=1 Tax=Citricoccus parietis TaxID=592307 RepID=A0ABV5FTZ2_9MICC